MVTLPIGNEAVLVGCEGGNSIDKIFKIIWEGEQLKWVTLPQKLKYPRTSAVAMLIPDSMTNCN